LDLLYQCNTSLLAEVALGDMHQMIQLLLVVAAVVLEVCSLELILL
jgi:hypothetical protein